MLRSLAKGRRWSRIAVAIVALLQIVSIVRTALGGMPIYAAPVRFLDSVLLAATIILLFTPAANAWFRRRE